jgi:hypothetical protein
MIIALLLVPIIGVLFLLPISSSQAPIASDSIPSSSLALAHHNEINNVSLPSQASSLRDPSPSPKGKGEVVSERDKVRSAEKMKQVALFFSLVNFFISIIMWYQFDLNSSTYQFVYEFNQLNFCHFHVGIDGISLYFVLLTTFITPICILSN